ncbi:MAG: cytochrome b/b6 domain-containing protein [Alphaproteobacteria bacterium]
MSIKVHHMLLKGWHAWVAGSFLVAYLTADEDTYAMHLFAGYAVLAAIAARLLVGVLAPASSPLSLPRPSLRAAQSWIATGRGRHPLFAILAVALLAMVGGAAVSGVFADALPWLEDPHEAIAEASLLVIFGHIAFVAYTYGGRRLLGKLTARFNETRPSTQSREQSA